MRVHLLALGVSLLASWGIAEETVILSDGSRMQVQSTRPVSRRGRHDE